MSYHSGDKCLKTGLLFLFMLKLHPNKIVIALLAALSVFLSGGSEASAAPRTSYQHVSYSTQLGNDLDGDHIPETATIRQCGYFYQISIHFTTGRPKLRLKTYVTEDAAGLSLQTADINNDSKGDLVVISATSLRPIAVWLNQGTAKFQRVSSWVYGGVGRYTGPAYRHRRTSQPEPIGNIWADPLPQATLVVEYFGLDNDPAGLLASQTEQLPFESLFRQLPPRGPPVTSRV